MTIGERLRTIRKSKNLTQAEIERRTGLMWCYISRLENGHVVPGVPTLEKLARALETPLYQILYEGDNPPEARKPAAIASGGQLFGSDAKDAKFLKKIVRALEKMSEKDRQMVLVMAQRIARERGARARE